MLIWLTPVLTLFQVCNGNSGFEKLVNCHLSCTFSGFNKLVLSSTFFDSFSTSSDLDMRIHLLLVICNVFCQVEVAKD